MREELNINGFQNEFIIARSLNNKKVGEVNPIFRNMIYNLYGDVRVDSRINAFIDFNKKKYDLIIKINGVNKRISVKKGINNSVHCERISDFIHFLIELNLDKDVITEYLKYHYADGTTNGSGKNRLNGEEYKKYNQDKIDYINSKINTSFILKRAIDRFILQGKDNNEKIDGLIYGTSNDFFFLTCSEIENIVLSQIDMYSTGVHFGPLFCGPQTRNLNNNMKYDSKRFCVQIKWYSLHDDIIRNMMHNNSTNM